MTDKNNTEEHVPTQTVVRKRNGSLEPIDIQKIIRAVTRCASGIANVDPDRVAIKTIGGLYDGATTKELDQLSIRTAATLSSEDPNYAKLAAALLGEYIRKEVSQQDIHSFSQSITVGHSFGLIDDRLHNFVTANARKLDNAVKDENNRFFEYWGIRSVYDLHLLRHPETFAVIETPQQMFMRIAASEARSVRDAVERYHQIAKNGQMPIDDPKWFLRGTKGQQPVASVIAETVESIPFRTLKGGMGQAVAERTILRKDEQGNWETWGDVAERVARGNASLTSTVLHPSESEYKLLRGHLAKATTLMSGRHLQHGDADQKKRPMEVFTNCSTSATSFLLFYLLLNGSGVGRAYDDDMIVVNWDYAPNIRCVLDSSHPDFVWGIHENVRDARHKYVTGGNVIWFEVPDSREGWAKALELWEVMASEKIHANKLLVLDFSKVRCKGSPIRGMQDRPASGPVPLMAAFFSAASLKGAGLTPWKQALFVDHYFAECVLVGGARRAARMSTKYWRDKTIFDFITVKRPIEYQGMDASQILEFRRGNKFPPTGFLWSSNNSVGVDEEFWQLVRSVKAAGSQSELEKHAKAVFKAICMAAYADGTGEPGIINLHKLVQKDEGLSDLTRGDFVESAKYKLNDDTQILMSRLAKKTKRKKYHMITNPCGEIVLSLLGAFCVIVDGVPFHCDTLDEAEDMFRAVTRAMIRVNLMDSIYNREVKRTNRIGVGLTGVHEFAWKFFGFGEDVPAVVESGGRRSSLILKESGCETLKGEPP